MLQKQFRGSSEYFTIQNYKYESIFHVAGKNNALESLQFIVAKHVFIEHMLRRDYEGNTPLHAAAKAGHLEILRWFCQLVTPGFLEVQNDFGFTPKQAAQEKANLYNEQLTEGRVPPGKVDKYKSNFTGCTLCVNFLNEFTDFVTEERWNESFEMSLQTWLETEASCNLRIFMGMPKANDLLVKSKYQKKRVKPEPFDGSVVRDEEMNQM